MGCRPSSRRRSWVALACALVYGLTQLLPGLHLTFVPHVWEAEGGAHSCGRHVLQAADEREPGAALEAAAADELVAEACPFAGPERPRTRLARAAFPARARRRVETAPLPVRQRPRPPTIEPLRLAPKTSPPDRA